jgi:hypothetical protein
MLFFVNSPISSYYRSESVETKGTMRFAGSSLQQQATKDQCSGFTSLAIPSLPSPSSPETAFVLIPQTAFGKMPFIHSRKKKDATPIFTNPRSAFLPIAIAN